LHIDLCCLRPRAAGQPQTSGRSRLSVSSKAALAGSTAVWPAPSSRRVARSELS
jgi:hypothetical protein